jgi:hypothetical protein
MLTVSRRKPSHSRRTRAADASFVSISSRLRVLASLLRLTPGALRARRRIAKSADVPRSELESWLVAPR